MTIKQQGGIFGRNPTFNDVEASKLDIDNINIDGNTISSTDANGNVILDPNGTGSTKVERTLLVNTDAGTNETRLVSIRVNGTDREIFAHEPGGNARPLVLRTQELTFRNDAAVHATFNTSGNLAFSSGKGIDFSATSGTGTSELFDDYEEGTWTPTITFGNNSAGQTYSTQSASYTKIGNRVLVSGYIVLTAKGSSTGIARISGLPFNVPNSDAAQSAASLRTSDVSFANQLIAFAQKNTTIIVFSETTEAGTTTNLSEGNFADNSIVVFSCQYYTG